MNDTIVGLGLSEIPICLLSTNWIFLGPLQLFMHLMIFSLLSAMENTPRGVIPAALALGTNWLLVFFKVILPLTKEGLVNDGTLVFTVR